MGKELISASGKGHSAITTWWIICLVSTFVLVALGVTNGFGYMMNLVAFMMSGTTVPVKSFYTYSATIGLIGGAFCMIPGYLCTSRISKTFIQVYEDGIKGSSVVPKFPLSFMLYGSISSLQVADFQLTYDQISSVDVVDGKSLLIHATNAQHKIYAMNAREVRDVIVEQKNKGRGGAQ